MRYREMNKEHLLDPCATKLKEDYKLVTVMSETKLVFKALVQC